MTERRRVTELPAKQTGHIIRDSALGLVPDIVEPYLVLNKTLWNDGPLSPADLEMARLRNARKVNCVFCKSVRYDIAVEAGLNEDKVSQIQDDHQASETLCRREKLLLAFTDQYLDNPGGMSDSLKAELTAQFSPEELVHLSIGLVMVNAYSRAAVAMGGMPEGELPISEISVPE